MHAWLHKFDSTVATYITSWPAFLSVPMVIVSFLGQPFITMGIVVAIGWFGWANQNFRLLLASIFGFLAILFNAGIKMLLERDRPVTDYVKNMWFDTFSFPSGHACGATIAYGLLAYLAWYFLPQPWSIVAIVALIFLILLVGISRVYLGAHYASDVLGGWLIGAVTLYIIIYAIRPIV